MATIVLTVLLFGYLGAQLALADTIPGGTTAWGHEVGGLPSAQARAALEEDVQDFNTSPMVFEVEGWEYQIPPETAGVQVDLAATVSQVTGFTLAPSRLWHHLFGGPEIAPVVNTDLERLSVAVLDVKAHLSREPIDAAVRITGTEAEVITAEPRVVITAEEVVELVEHAWPLGQLEVPAEVTRPDVETVEATRVAALLNGHILAGPTLLTSPNGDVELAAEQVAGVLRVVQDGRTLRLEAEVLRLGSLVTSLNDSLDNEPRDAAFLFTADHELVVDPGDVGRALNVPALGDALLEAVAAQDRSGPLPYVEVQPEVTAGQLRASEIQELVSGFSTPLTPRGAARERNISIAAEKLTGVIVLPGEVFSLGDAISPIDRANGYVPAGAIVNGEYADAMGGGLSQTATTMYNAAYFAGLEMVEFRPHTEWFPRYPAGREATIYLPGLDHKWRNDTPYAILINSYIEGANIHIDLWSTPHFEVETTMSNFFNRRNGGYRTVTETPCSPRSPKEGFTVTNTRKVYLDGVIDKDETFTWAYRAVPGIRCEAPEDD